MMENGRAFKKSSKQKTWSKKENARSADKVRARLGLLGQDLQLILLHSSGGNDTSATSMTARCRYIQDRMAAQPSWAIRARI